MGIVQRDSFRITIISYIGAAIGYLNKVFLFTNLLTTEQVGLANIMITISVIYAQVAAMGSYNITLRFFPFFNDRNQKHHGFLFAMVALISAGFVVATLLFAIMQRPFKLLYTESSPLLVEYIWYIIPMALASLFYQFFESYLRSLHKNTFPSIVHELMLRIFITIAILLFALNLISFPEFVAIYVGVNCLPAIVIVIYTHIIRQLLIYPTITSSVKRLGKIMLIYGVFSLFNNLSAMLLFSIDSLMVAGMIDLGAAGVYTTMVFITSVLLIPYRAMIKVSGPIVSKYWKNRDMTGMQDIYHKATATNMVIGGAIFLLIWVNLDSIFSLMPGDYEAGRFVFLFLGMGKLFDMAAGLNGTILLTSKKYRFDLMFTIGLVVVAIISNMILIPIFGMNGAAIASMLSMIVFNLIRIIFISVQFRLQPFEWKQVSVPLILFVIMIISGAVGQIANLIIDVLLRSSVAALLFIIPVYFLNISGDINAMLAKYKKLLVRDADPQN
jgi:O-antigen/teichoic acid export membrane protein